MKHCLGGHLAEQNLERKNPLLIIFLKGANQLSADLSKLPQDHPILLVPPPPPDPPNPHSLQQTKTMGDLDKTSIIILVCVLTAAVITICLIAIIVYRKKWCRRSEDQPEISGSISLSDIHAYEEDRGSNIWNLETVDKPPVPVVAPMPPPPPDPPNPET
ncbi:unnamed protein product [Mytilus edulis]|uniref:Uncharacterized protein n=1 Tax=Mytilus edulis TaxID=6550 RepID=A0A8S3UP65_MYTED|nr:unnamed protein product [Mytilus edulis]